MVNGTVGVVLVAIGVIAGLAAVAAGGLFMTNDSFATAQRACNPSVRTNPADQAAASGNCEDDVVVDDNGDACQVANLGIYSASFTPECTYGTSYEINTLLSGQVDVNPLELVPLFAAQNGFGSIGEALGAVEFTDCESFFDTDAVATSPILGTGAWGTGASAQAADGSLETVAASVKAGFDGTIDANVAELGTTLFVEAHINLLEGPANLPLASFGFALDGTTTLESEIPSPALAPTTGIIADLGAAGNIVNATDPAAADLIYNVAGTLATFAPSFPPTTPTRSVLQFAAAFGTEFAGAGAISGIPAGGPWADFDSSVLCASIGGTCTVSEYLQFVAASLTALGDPRADDVNAALELFNVFLLANTLNAALAEAAVALGGVDADAVNTVSVVSGIKDAAFNLTRPLKQSVFVNAVTSVNPIIDGLNDTLVARNFAFAALCDAGGQPETCNQPQLFTALAAISTAGGDTDTAELLGLLALVTSTCIAQNHLTWTDCLNFGLGTSSLNKGQPLWAAGTNSLLASFYDTSDFGVSGILTDLEGFAAEMIEQCNDAGLTGDAIALNQTTVPAGTIILAIGTIIMAINLVVRGENVKKVGAVGGLIALVGAVLALAGFLVLQGAPIYASLTAPEPEVKPDDVNAFATGVGLLYALALIGGGIVGSLCFLLGTLCIAPKGDASTEILGKA